MNITKNWRKYLKIARATVIIVVALYGVFHKQLSVERTSDGGGEASVPTQTDSALRESAATVARVVDGDTVALDYEGKEITVRVIGINTPEIVDPRRTVECFGKEASAEAHRLLDGQNVTISFDESQSRTDKYGRTLAYITLSDGKDFGYEMIHSGFAYEYTYKIPYERSVKYKGAEKSARESKSGLWNENTCNGSKKLS